MARVLFTNLFCFCFLQQIYRSHQQALAGASSAANQGPQQSLALLQQQQQQLFAQQQLAGKKTSPFLERGLIR